MSSTLGRSCTWQRTAPRNWHRCCVGVTSRHTIPATGRWLPTYEVIAEGADFCDFRYIETCRTAATHGVVENGSATEDTLRQAILAWDSWCIGHVTPACQHVRHTEVSAARRMNGRRSCALDG